VFAQPRFVPLSAVAALLFNVQLRICTEMRVSPGRV